MQFQFLFKHMESSNALKDYAESKIREKVEKYSTKPIEAHISFAVERHNHVAHVSVVGGDGFNVQVQAECPDMYGSIDLLVDKMETQLKRQKEKLKDHKKQKGVIPFPMEVVDRKDDCDAIPVDAEDLIKYEQAKGRANG